MKDGSLFNLDGLSGYDFEDLVARIMKKAGYHNIQLTPKSNDKGKDIIMKYIKGEDSYPVVVECKHQNFVGRPVVQKLQGAMLHEKKSDDFIKGIIVTSGKFSPTVYSYVKEINKDHKGFMEIELVDGKALKKMCEKYEIIILNGKIQIITNNTIDFIEGKDIEKEILEAFKNVVGHEDKLLKHHSEIIFHPCYYLKYNINSEFCTSIGCVNTIQKNNEEIFLDGTKTSKTREELREHFFSKGFPHIIQLKRGKDKKVIPFEFTEKEIEDTALDTICNENTEAASYYGRNNVKYTKICKPSSRDVDISDVRAIYLPQIINNIKIKNQDYIQKLYSNRKSLFYEENGLSECKVCSQGSTFWDNKLYFCKKCGRILCSSHSRLDSFDNTPVCLKCVFREKLTLQTKYFISKKNKAEYIKKYNEMGFIRKIYEDKILFWSIIGAFSLAIFSIVGNLA